MSPQQRATAAMVTGIAAGQGMVVGILLDGWSVLFAVVWVCVFLVVGYRQVTVLGSTTGAEAGA